MAHADFTDKEVGILKETLESYLSELASEIYTTGSLSVQDATERVDKMIRIRDLIDRMGKMAA